MHGVVEVGTCRNQPCGQAGPLLEDGHCSDTCRIEATGCAVPGCTCRGACEGVSPCADCRRYAADVVAGPCADCRQAPEPAAGAPAGARP
jgi:hypothetical protein